MPSSKADVFAAPLGLVEKRQLMKFLQFALEHAAAVDMIVTQLNEKTLGAGRSLKRYDYRTRSASCFILVVGGSSAINAHYMFMQ